MAASATHPRRGKQYPRPNAQDRAAERSSNARMPEIVAPAGVDPIKRHLKWFRPSTPKSHDRPWKWPKKIRLRTTASPAFITCGQRIVSTKRSGLDSSGKGQGPPAMGTTKRLSQEDRLGRPTGGGEVSSSEFSTTSTKHPRKQIKPPQTKDRPAAGFDIPGGDL